MGSSDDWAGRARRRVSVRRWLAGALALVAGALGLVAVESPAWAAAPRWLTVSTGTDHTCAIKTNTTLWCWGANDKGQLGVEGIVESDTPVEVGGAGWSVVSAGYWYTCGIRNGRRYCWGDNTWGQLGLRDTRDRSTPVVGPGESNNWLTISAMTTHTCGLRTSGLAQCWGDNGGGQLGIDSSVSMRNRPTTVAGGITWSTISVGAMFTCGLDVDGRRYCWGYNDVGRLGLGLDEDEQRSAPDYLPGDHTYSSIDVGGASACAVTTAGQLTCWGWNHVSQLGLGDMQDRPLPTVVAGNNWQSVSITDRHACGLRSVSPSSAADQRYCWGLNGAGQLGDGTRTDSATPRWVDDGSWRMVATGRTHACGISSGKYLYCWGSNLDGQLGVGWDVVNDRALEPLLVR